MTDEVKITVIATGFNREPKAAAEARPAFAQRGFGARAPAADAPAPQTRPARDFDTPSFLRRNPAPASGAARTEAGGAHYAALQDELDVPTFLRRQMD
jgi:hypothetical protein